MAQTLDYVLTCQLDSLPQDVSYILPEGFTLTCCQLPSTLAGNVMNYRAPVVINNELDQDVLNLFTDAQWRWFAIQSARLDKPVSTLIIEMKPMAEQINSDSNEVYLFGYLPNCNLYGCVSPDGTSHT